MKNAPRRRATALALVILVAGCTDPLGPQRDDLSGARARWEAAGIGTYAFELRRFCFCGPDALREARIVVEQGEAVSATWVDTGEPVTDYPFGELPTIEDLFAEIQDAIDRDAADLTAEYDPQLGYPANVAIDFSYNIADEEKGFAIEGFEPLEPLEGTLP